MNIGMKKPSLKKNIKIGDTEKIKDTRSTTTKNKGKNDNSNIRESINELEKSLGINTKPKNVPRIFIIFGWLCVLSKSRPTIIIGLILATIAIILSFTKSYKNAFRWNKAITLYFRNDIEKAKIHLDKLSSTEKEGQAYEKMLKLLK